VLRVSYRVGNVTAQTGRDYTTRPVVRPVAIRLTSAFETDRLLYAMKEGPRPTYPDDPQEEERFWDEALSRGWAERGAQLTRDIALRRFGLVLPLADAEDIFGEARARVVMKTRENRWDAEFVAQQIRGFVINVLRERRKQYAVRDHRSLQFENPELFDHLTASKAVHTSDGELKERLGKVVSLLSPQDRKFFYLYFCEGLDGTEVASRLRMSNATVSRRKEKITSLFCAWWNLMGW